MNDEPKKSGFRRTANGRRAFRARWLVVALSPILVAAVLLLWALPRETVEPSKLGLVQPVIAALLALTVVLSMRLTWGRFTNQRRKGVSSASSAAIAVRLWAICFALLFAAILLSALLARLPNPLFTRAESATKAVEAHVEVNSNGVAPAVRSSIEVTR